MIAFARGHFVVKDSPAPNGGALPLDLAALAVLIQQASKATSVADDAMPAARRSVSRAASDPDLLLAIDAALRPLRKKLGRAGLSRFRAALLKLFVMADELDR